MSTYTHQEAIKESKNYFGGNELAANIWIDKYALRNNDNDLVESNPNQMHERIAKEFARIEKHKFKNPYTYEEIYNAIKDFGYIIPQGSPMFGIGNPYQYVSLSNCFVVETHDSYGGILNTDQQLVQIAKRRGGNGVDLSSLRPVNYPTQNSSRTSTGIVSFAKRYSNSTREVGQSGRRGALMLTISVHHPQILDFINMKRDLKEVTGANVSIRLTDEFLQAVDSGTDYELRWPVENTPKISQKISAKLVWDAIIDAAWTMAEPGILFWDHIIRESPADCYPTYGFNTVSTNPSLRSDTYVLTNSGAIQIKELNGKAFYVINAKKEWQKANCFLSGEKKQLYKITTTNNQEIFCTKEHKWPVLNSTNNLFNAFGKVIKVETSKLKRRDKLYFPKLNNPIDNKDCKFSFDDGFILGWITGDGWLSYHKTNKSEQIGVVFNVQDYDSGIADKVLDYTNNLAKVKSSLRKDHGNSNCFTFCTTDKNVLSKLKELGLQNKSNGIPTSVFRGCSQFVRGYVDGLFSADGYIETNKKLSKCKIVLVTSHEKLAKSCQILLSFYGIKSNIKKSSGPSKFPKYNSNKIYTRYDLVISGIHTQKFADAFSLSSVDKQNKLNNIIKLGGEEYANTREYLIVKSVEATEIYEDVYDITVHDDTNSFITSPCLTGNCGEIPLCSFDSCRLMVLNLMMFVENPFTNEAYFNWDKFKKYSIMLQRLMDDMIDLEIESIDKIINKIKNDPEKLEIKITELNLWNSVKTQCEKGRRTGTGITALGDTIAALNMGYGSKQGISFTKEVYKTLKLSCYKSSVEMAKELGAFPVWNPDLEKNNPFIERIKIEDAKLYEDMMKYGRRNIALLTTAPVGTVSLLAMLSSSPRRFGTTSGIEPAYEMSYLRNRKINEEDVKQKKYKINFIDQNGDAWEQYEVYHQGVKLWMDITGETDPNKSPYYKNCARELDGEIRVCIQAEAQKHIDHSISSTVNLPNDATREDVAKIYMMAWKSGCKGITVYRDGCRTGVLTDIKEKIKKNQAIKRPKELKCEIHQVNKDGKHYNIIVGMVENEPYEVFITQKKNIDLKDGILHRAKRGHYILKNSDGTIEIDNILEYCSDDQEALGRMVSTSLRHGVDIKYIVQQLEKVNGHMNIFSKITARILKKYIPDGTTVSGEGCVSCGCKTLVRSEGCKSCPECGWSKC